MGRENHYFLLYFESWDKKTITFYYMLSRAPRKPLLFMWCWVVGQENHYFLLYFQSWPKKTITFYVMFSRGPRKPLLIIVFSVVGKENHYFVLYLQSWAKKTITFYYIFLVVGQETITFYCILSCGPSVGQQNHYVLYGNSYFEWKYVMFYVFCVKQ